MRIATRSLATGVLILTLGVAAGAPAQGLWTEPHGDRNLTLEFVPPALDRVDFSTFSRTMYLSGRFSSGGQVGFVFEAPFAYVAFEDRDNSETAFGNVYVGIDVGRPGSGFTGEFGVRLPSTPDNKPAGFAGAISDYMDRYEAFIPDIVTFVMAGRYYYRSDGALAVRIRTAPTLWIDQGDALRDDSELWLLSTFKILAESENVALGVGYSNRLLVSEDEPELTDRMDHQFTFFANLHMERWRPGLQVRVPVGDLGDRLNSTVALSIGVDLD